MTAPSKPLPVFSLQCHAHVEMTLACLPTLLRHCRDPIELIILDDGSLTAEDCDRLREALGPVRVIPRAEGDDLLAPLLAGKPRCAAYRRAHPFGLKLLDSALHSAGGAFLMCDGDIRFFRDFRRIDRRGTGDELTFMKDFGSSYIFKRLSMEFGRYRVRRPECVNAGLLYCDGATFDLDFVEWYIGNPKFSFYNHLAEQTVWAALAGRVRSSCFDPAQIRFPAPGMSLRPGLVGMHYVGFLRYLATEPEHSNRVEAYVAGLGDAEPETLRTEPPIYRGLAAAAARAAYRKVQPRPPGLVPVPGTSFFVPG